MTQIKKLSKKTIFRFHVIICILCLSSFGMEAIAQPWTQLGQDINGEEIGDWFGGAVAINSGGDIIAVGAPSSDAMGTNAGQVIAYSWDGFTWSQRGNEINGPFLFEQGGTSVSLDSSGNTLATAAPGNGVSGSDIGHIRIYSWNGSDWVQKGVTIDGEHTNDISGTSISLSADGNILAIGAPQNQDNGQTAGHVRLYSWDGNAWLQKGTDIDGEATGDRFGRSVSLSSDGNAVAIGAYGNGSSDAGHARVYIWDGNDWAQKGIDLDGEDNFNLSGFSVSIDALGNTIAIGAPDNAANGFRAGHVRIYSWNGSAWVQKGIDLDGLEDDQLGWTVSISSSGNVVACGARGNGQFDPNNYEGYVKVYTWDGSLWTPTGSTIDQNTFGVLSTGISSNGNTLVLGIPVKDGPIPNTTYAGKARVYQFDTDLGITDLNFENEVTLYPNPTNGKFKVHGITGELKIYTVLGELIYTQNKVDEETFIDISNQSNGIFFLNIKDDQHTVTVKVLIQK